MNCHDLELFVQELLDGAARALPPAAVEHLAECANCRELHQTARVLEAGLHLLPAPTPPAGLSQRLVASVTAERHRPSVRHFRVAAVAVAASVLLLLIPVLNWFMSGTEVTTPNPVDKQAHVVPSAPKQPEPPPPSLKSSVDEARLAVVSLTERLADKTTKQAQKLLTAAATPELPPMAPAASMTEFDASFDPARRSLQEVTANVGSGLQVVTGSAQQAVNYFTREIPTFKSKNKTP